MGMYGYLDAVRAGVLDGLDHNFESRKAVSALKFGAPVFYKNGDEKFGYKANRNALTATLSGDLVTSNVITTTVTLNGVALTPVASTFAGDHATTLAAHIAAIAALTGVTCAAGTAARSYTVTGDADTDNVGFVSVVTLGAGQATVSYSAATNATKFGGIAVLSQRSTNTVEGEYPAGDMVSVCTEGEIWVRVADNLTLCANKPAYVVFDSDEAAYGQFTPTSSVDTYDAGAYFRGNPIVVGTGETFARIEVRGLK